MHFCWNSVESSLKCILLFVGLPFEDASIWKKRILDLPKSVFLCPLKKSASSNQNFSNIWCRKIRPQTKKCIFKQRKHQMKMQRASAARQLMARCIFNQEKHQIQMQRASAGNHEKQVQPFKSKFREGLQALPDHWISTNSYFSLQAFFSESTTIFSALMRAYFLSLDSRMYQGA